ncbi:tyrosine--tRNA mitochondrial, partial [Brachionus plicatilis]
IGGNDQTGNIKTGHELISKLKPDKRIFGLTLPIITSEKGDKLGKSAGNAVWLEQDMFSAFDFYQFFYNTSDQMVETYLKLFTFLPINEIDDLMLKHQKSPEKFLAQRKLASELTILVHGESGLDSAIKCTNAFFHSDRESLAKMSDKEVESTFRGASSVSLTMAPEMSVLECAVEAQCFRSVEDAAAVIKAGGFRINGTLITNPQESLIFGQHILTNNITIIRVGK